MAALGQPCDENGNYLPPGAPPPPVQDPSDDDWTPYDDRNQFELADFIFRCNQMLANDINDLLDIWAATLFKHHDHPPFANCNDLYETIDSTPRGDVLWESFSTSYNGPLPEGEVPPWMSAKYDVWFRDPRTIIRNMIGNPDYKGEMDYTPFQEFEAADGRQFQNFMSGEWAWKQAVCLSYYVVFSH
jgi:hypothetical protein